MNKDVIGELIAVRRKLAALLNSPQHSTVRKTLNALDDEIEKLETALNEQRGATLIALQQAAGNACKKLDKALADLKKGLDIAVQVNQALAILTDALA